MENRDGKPRESKFNNQKGGDRRQTENKISTLFNYDVQKE